MILSLFAAAAENDVIGRNNALPWSLPDDLQYFRRITKGHTVVMGRKTFESIGNALPDRRNIIISSSMDEAPPGCEVYASVGEALLKLNAEADDGKKVFVIGGAQLFNEFLMGKFLETADKIYLTRVHAEAEGDIVLPPIDWSTWRKVSAKEHPADERHAYAFTFEVYERKR